MFKLRSRINLDLFIYIYNIIMYNHLRGDSMDNKVKKKKLKTISEMTGSRGYMPPPQRADIPKKGKGSYKRKNKKLKNMYTKDWF